MRRESGQKGRGVKRSKAHRRAAFTLVEVLVVVVIIGVLAALITPRLFQNVDRARINATKSMAASLSSAVQSFRMNCRELKTSDDLKGILWNKPSDVSDAAWDGPYVNSEEDLLDAWGNPFSLRVPGQKNVDFDVVSYGADGQPGGEGVDSDITN